MDAFFEWLAQYGALGGVVAVVVLALAYIGNKIASGDWVPARTVEWQTQNQKDLVTAIERLTEAVTQNTAATRDSQTSIRDLQESERDTQQSVANLLAGQQANLHALESFQRAREGMGQ